MCVCVCLLLPLLSGMQIAHFLCWVYCELCPVSFYYIILYTAWFSGKNLLNVKFILIFNATVFLNTSHYMVNSDKYCNKVTQVFTWSTHYFRLILIALEFSLQTFEKYLNQISWKSVQWKPSCSMRKGRRTGDRDVEANSCLAQYCERDYKLRGHLYQDRFFNRFLFFFKFQ